MLLQNVPNGLLPSYRSRTRDGGRQIQLWGKQEDGAGRNVCGFACSSHPVGVCHVRESSLTLSGDLPLSLNGAKMNPSGIALGVSMKTATIPSLRVEPALRRAAEEVLRDGESLSGFIEYAVLAQIQQRQEQAAFIARGLASRDQAKATGVYFSSGAVLKKLDARWVKAKKASA